MGYVDVHTHLTHKEFENDRDQVIEKAYAAGVRGIVVNGLDPESNRMILHMAQKHSIIYPSLGIYPTHAAYPSLQKDDLPWELPGFDLDQEILFIKEKALGGQISAIGEIGLDGHWLPDHTFSQQEKVFRNLIDIGIEANLPIILHSRKLETRAIDILQEHQPSKVIFHCYSGKSNLAVQTAEKTGWSFSIPANARRNGAFQKLLKLLPLESILTETDAPYLPPEKFSRNEPINVVHTVALMAEIRELNIKTARSTIWDNFNKLFKRPKHLSFDASPRPLIE